MLDLAYGLLDRFGGILQGLSVEYGSFIVIINSVKILQSNIKLYKNGKREANNCEKTDK